MIATPDTQQAWNGKEQSQYKVASVTTSLLGTGTTQTIVAAVAGKKIRIIALRAYSTTAITPANCAYVNIAGGQTIMHALPHFAVGGIMMAPPTGFLVETAVGDGFGFKNSTGGNVGDCTHWALYLEV